MTKTRKLQVSCNTPLTPINYTTLILFLEITYLGIIHLLSLFFLLDGRTCAAHHQFSIQKIRTAQQYCSKTTKANQ